MSKAWGRNKVRENVSVQHVLRIDTMRVKTTLEEDERLRSRRFEDALEVESPHENEKGSEHPVPVRSEE